MEYIVEVAEAGICGAAIACVIYAIVKRLIYIYHFPPNKGKKVKEQRLSLQGLEYTLVEIYRILKRRLDYPNLKTIDMEESRICIYCKHSKQYLSLDNGELILQREKDDTSTASLIDMECLIAAITECLGLPVEKGSKELLSQRKYDKWSYKIIFALFVIVIIMMALSDTSSPVNRVKNTAFSILSDTVTIGEALDGYFEETTWEAYRTNNTQYVQFTGEIDGEEMYVIFELDGDMVEIVELGSGYLSFTDPDTIYLFLYAIYNGTYESPDNNSASADMNEYDMEEPDYQENEGENIAAGTAEEAAENVYYDTEDYTVWIGDYQRTRGPACSISVWEADENGLLFAANIGYSGADAYVDMRDCVASWINESTAVYQEEDYEITFTYMDGTLYLTENMPEPYGSLSIAGEYTPIEEAVYPDCEYVFPFSSEYEVMEVDCDGLTAEECRIAKNEIYARHGRMFDDPLLQNYFDSCSWYTPSIASEDFTENMLSETEKASIWGIEAYEGYMGY